jgi:hypothetical protein
MKVPVLILWTLGTSWTAHRQKAKAVAATARITSEFYKPDVVH